ncbi:unnamed protein product [marine sediment metagenome]|uniref:Uncharacterized protein n=1 Tax=marine sediment metagenome TaxID=412755 RepID=X0UWA6_9ZZZZ
MLFGYQGAISKNRDQKTHSLEYEIDIEEILPYKGFTAGDKTPQGSQRDGFISNLLYFFKGKLTFSCQLVVSREINVTMPAVKITAGSDFQLKFGKAPFVIELFPKRKFGQRTV